MSVWTSKLVDSHIARQFRCEVIHTMLVKFLKANDLSVLPPEQQEGAKSCLGEDSSKPVYRSDADTLQGRFSLIGGFVMEVLAAYQDIVTVYGLLHRLFDKQYAIEDCKAVLRGKKSVKVGGLQTPDDLDVSYRDKNGQKVQGYVTNITETVEEGELRIITSV